MNSAVYWVAGGILLLLAIGAYILYDRNYFDALGENQTTSTLCATDVKLCPEGSYVSRIPPSCAFASCSPLAASSTLPRGPIEIRAGLNESVSGLGVTLIPLSVLEDSRCPSNVTCIQAGTVRLRTKITSASGSSMETLELGEPFTTEAEVITLVQVLPDRTSDTNIAPSTYEFVFKIEKRKAGTNFDVKG